MSKFYITTSIPYVNAAPHIGFALELIQADAAARYERLREKEVFFLTGADENGLKNFQTALSQNKTPQDFVSENTALFQKLLEILQISNDDFVRTSDRNRHWPTAQKLWSRLEAAGDIYKKTYSGFYCAGHESFHPEGDLVNGECPDYPGRKLQLVEEENYFFRLSKYAAELKRLIGRGEIKIIPAGRANEMLNLVDKGLEDVSFSRIKTNLPWGVPVPSDAEHVMYVWCDALSNYLTGVDYAEAGAKFQKFWPPDLHVIGKDILRFHALIWPAMLIAAKLPLPKAILVHGFITAGGQKMSKSLGNVIDPFAIASKYGTDALRYFLLREIPTTDDGDFTEEKLKERYNADLAHGLGNLLSRILAIGVKYGKEIALDTENLKSETETAWDEYRRTFNEYKFHESLSTIWRLLHRVDEYLNEKEPWRLLNEHNRDFAESAAGDEIAQVLSSAVLALANIAWMLQPFMPGTAYKMMDALRLERDKKEPWLGRVIKLQKVGQLFPQKE